MLESSRDMLIPRYSRCRDIVGSEYKSHMKIYRFTIPVPSGNSVALSSNVLRGPDLAVSVFKGPKLICESSTGALRVSALIKTGFTYL